MSASLVRKALDETSFASGEKLEQLSKASKKKFKPKTKKKVSSEKLLKQNLKILKALEYRFPSKTQKYSTTSSSATPIDNPSPPASSSKKNKSGKKKKKEGGEGSSSIFTDEDFEKFEKEYFVS